MSETAIIAVMASIVAALPPTIAAVAALVVSLRNGRKSDEIHTLVNSNMDALRKDLSMALAKVEVLEAVITKRREDDYYAGTLSAR